MKANFREIMKNMILFSEIEWIIKLGTSLFPIYLCPSKLKIKLNPQKLRKFLMLFRKVMKTIFMGSKEKKNLWMSQCSRQIKIQIMARPIFSKPPIKFKVRNLSIEIVILKEAKIPKLPKLSIETYPKLQKSNYNRSVWLAFLEMDKNRMKIKWKNCLKLNFGKFPEKKWNVSRGLRERKSKDFQRSYEFYIFNQVYNHCEAWIFIF